MSVAPIAAMQIAFLSAINSVVTACWGTFCHMLMVCFGAGGQHLYLTSLTIQMAFGEPRPKPPPTHLGRTRAQLLFSAIPNKLSIVVEQFGVVNGATSAGEATITRVAGVCRLVKSNEDLESGVVGLLGWKHALGKAPDTQGSRDQSENVNDTHSGLIC